MDYVVRPEEPVELVFVPFAEHLDAEADDLAKSIHMRRAEVLDRSLDDEAHLAHRRLELFNVLEAAGTHACPDAVDIGGSLAYRDGASRVEDVEGVGALERHVEGRVNERRGAGDTGRRRALLRFSVSPFLRLFGSQYPQL